MKFLNKSLEIYLLKESIRENWKGFILLFLLLSVCFVILYSGAAPIVSSKEHIGVLELRTFAADKTLMGEKKSIFVVALPEERVSVITPLDVPFHRGEKVIVFEDTKLFGFKKFRYGGYAKDKIR